MFWCFASSHYPRDTALRFCLALLTDGRSARDLPKQLRTKKWSVRLTAVLVAGLWKYIFSAHFVSAFWFRIFVSLLNFLSLSDICFGVFLVLVSKKSHGLELELACGALVVEHREQLVWVYVGQHWERQRADWSEGFARFSLSFFTLFAITLVVNFLVFVGVLVYMICDSIVVICRVLQDHRLRVLANSSI